MNALIRKIFNQSLRGMPPESLFGPAGSDATECRRISTHRSLRLLRMSISHLNSKFSFAHQHVTQSRQGATQASQRRRHKQQRWRQLDLKQEIVFLLNFFVVGFFRVAHDRQGRQEAPTSRPVGSQVQAARENQIAAQNAEFGGARARSETQSVATISEESEDSQGAPFSWNFNRTCISADLRSYSWL